MTEQNRTEQNTTEQNLKTLGKCFSSFNPFVPSLSKQQMTANSVIVVTYCFVTKLNHYLWAYINVKFFQFFELILS